MKAENEIELLTKIQRLKVSEKHWGKILESMSEMVTIHDKDFGIVYANPQALKRFGKTLEELRGRKCHEIYHNRREPLEFCPHLRAIKTGEPTIQEVVEPYLGGIFLISCSPIFDDEGNVTSTVHMVRDITERKQAEEALQKSEKKYRNLVDNALVGIYKTNLKGDILYVNKALSSMFEFESPEEMMSRGVLARYKNSKDREVLIENLQKTGKVNNLEIEVLTNKGKTKDILLNATLDRDVISGMIMDITERKMKEEELRRRLLKYRVEDGRVYLVWEKGIEIGLDVFSDLLKFSYEGFVISRNLPEEIRKRTDFEPQVFWLSERGRDSISPKLGLIRNIIEKNLGDRTIFFFEGLGYLIFKKGFERVLEFVQGLREIFYLRKGILIISANPEILSRRMVAMLEAETQRISSRLKIRLKPEIHDILRFIYTKNRVGERPLYKDIGREFGITRATVRKRIAFLKSHGLVFEERRGRRKLLQVTEKGREQFE